MIRLHWDGYTVEVASDVAEDLEWLQEYFCPPFRLEPTSVANARVRLRVDDDHYASWKALGPQGGQGDLFSLDGHYESLPLWRGPSLRLHDSQRELFYQAVESDRLEILAPRRAGHSARRRALLRAVRELLSLEWQSRGRLSLHASAFVWRGRAVAFLGPKGAGKTTSLLSCLRVPGAAYLTNDRLALDLDSGMAGAVATILNLRRSSLERLPHLDPQTLGNEYQLSTERPRPKLKDGGHVTGPAQLCRALGMSRMGQAPLGALLFLRLEPSLPGARTRALTPSQARKALEENLLYPGGERRHFALWPSLKRGVVPSKLSLPAYACELGPDALLDPTETSRWLEQLSGS